MIDSHCHLLPAIDDGPPDETIALEMARVAIEDGVETVIVTPHSREGDFPHDRLKILAAVAEFREVLQQAGCPLKIEAGAEIHHTIDMVARIRNGELLTYADGRAYVLLECPYRSRPMNLDQTIFELKVAGITTVIAHPERTNYFIERPERYEEMIRMGALGSMTAASLVGTFGRKIRALSEDWVRRRLVHILASDAHDPSYRPPKLTEARRAWAALDDELHATRATIDYPQALLTGGPIDPDPPLTPEEPRGFFSRFFSRG